LFCFVLFLVHAVPVVRVHGEAVGRSRKGVEHDQEALQRKLQPLSNGTFILVLIYLLDRLKRIVLT